MKRTGIQERGGKRVRARERAREIERVRGVPLSMVSKPGMFLLM